MSMYNDIDWDQKRNEEVRKQNSDDGHSSDQEMKKNGMGLSPTNLMGNGTAPQKNDENMCREWTPSVLVLMPTVARRFEK